MSNPARAPKELTAAQLSLAVAPDSYLPEGYADVSKRMKKVEEVQRALARKDMELRAAFVVPREHTLDKGIMERSGPALARAKTGVVVARSRSSYGKMAVNAGYARLPDGDSFAAEWRVREAMLNKVYVDGGTEAAIGRLELAYPDRGVKPSRPVSRAEADLALESCGLSMDGVPAAALRPYPLTPKEGDVNGVTVNPNSDNGFPVLTKWSEPGAALKCMELGQWLREQLARSADVYATVRELEATKPWLMAVKGKAKADYYTQEKVRDAKLRFYNVLPRQVMLNMQVATQVLEGNSQHILTQPGCHSGIGISLVRLGAEDLVGALDAQLNSDGVAFVHVGDDSWVVVRVGEYIVMFALDCSNFDLTQHSTVTEEVHRAVRDELRKIDRVAADLWYAYARERMVVVSGSLVRQFKHAGPSGMPLQSKVNDMLMDVMIRRALDLMDEDMWRRAIADNDLTWDDDRVAVGFDGGRGATCVAEAASSMGFVARLEQPTCVRAPTLKEALRYRPFLFIGYYFHTIGDTVAVCADIPRTFAQLPFPALKWAETREKLQVTEAFRIGSIAMNLGVPPPEVEEACEAVRQEARRQLEVAIRQYGDKTLEELRWAVGDTPWGAELGSSLRGLLRALERDPRKLWLEREPELPSGSKLVPVGASLSWADMADEDEAEEAYAARVTVARPAAERVRSAKLGPSKKPTHPATMANDGRPPPTAVWGPDKAPAMARAAFAPVRAGRRTRREGLDYRDFHKDLESAYLSEGSSYDSFEEPREIDFDGDWGRMD